MLEPLTPVQLRVLGVLIEKEATVPDTYPLTLKALQTGCNQQNNRDPVTDLDAGTVQAAVDELKARGGLVRFVHPSHGARSTKYRHTFDEHYGVEAGEQAVLAVLMLRGPNTTNELRVRTERYHAFADNEAVEATLRSLAAREEPLVVPVPPGPGQSQGRWMHLLGGEVDVDELAAAAPAAAPTRSRNDLAERVDALEARVAHLESLLADLGVSPSVSDSGTPTPEQSLGG